MDKTNCCQRCVAQWPASFEYRHFCPVRIPTVVSPGIRQNQMVKSIQTWLELSHATTQDFCASHPNAELGLEADKAGTIEKATEENKLHEQACDHRTAWALILGIRYR